MNLHELINIFENELTTCVSWSKIAPYKGLLRQYFISKHGGEPIFMVTLLTNNTCRGRIIAGDAFLDSVMAYLELDYISDDTESDDWIDYETICANSRMLKDC